MIPILYNGWKKFVEEHGEVWEGQDEFPESKLVYTPCDWIDLLFRRFGNELDGKTIVSAASDYHPCYQKDYPPEEDFRKFLPMMSLKGLEYSALFMPPRVNVGRSLTSDPYSIRMYSYTNSTFRDIPEINWYCAGSQIDECLSIPFGTDKDSFDLIQKYKGLPKKERVFYCCSFTTNERHDIYNKFKNVEGFHCVRDLDKEQYYYELCSSKYSLVMAGNSPDTYRHIDCIYADVIPLTIENKKHPYRSLLGRLTSDLKINYSIDEEDLKLIDFEYWQNLILRGLK